MRRLLVAIAVTMGLVVGALIAVVAPPAGAAPATAGSATAGSATAGSACVHRVLILSAMPLELNPLYLATTVDRDGTVHIDNKTFYLGRLDGADVALALTGIGPVNATSTTTLAMQYFRCAFAAVMFSGVAGSFYDIGDVTIPQRWTLNGGRSYVGTDTRMLAVARRLQGYGHEDLIQDLPLGDAACLCAGVDAPLPLHLPNRPVVHVGGIGVTTDPFGGHAVPCVWGGGDIAGCEPCVLAGNPVADAANLEAAAPPLASASFVTGLIGSESGSGGSVKGAVAGDEETAAVDTVAHRYGVPFLGIRAVSDGSGDPLHLPGFPVEFVVYRQLAGDNAAAVTQAFLRAWVAKGEPT